MSHLLQENDMTMAIVMEDEEASRIFQQSLQLGGKPVFENGKGTLIEVVFAFPEQREDGGCGSSIEGSPSVASLQHSRLYGWVEDVEESGEIIQAARPQGRQRQQASEESALVMMHTIPLRLHLWSTSQAERAAAASGGVVKNASGLGGTSPSSPIQEELHHRNDMPVVQNAVQTVMRYAEVLEQHPSIFREECFTTSGAGGVESGEEVVVFHEVDSSSA